MKENYKFCYINGNRIIVFNDPSQFFLTIRGFFLENATIEIKEGGNLRIVGEKIIIDFYFKKVFEKYWRNDPEEDEIKVKMSGIFKKRPKRYLEGLVRTKKRVPLDIEFGSGWVIERRIKDED